MFKIFCWIGDSEELWDLPLASAKSKKLDHLDDMKTFIGNIARPESLEVDITITRDKGILQQVIRRYKNPQFELGAPLNVQFISSGAHEQGIDAGGPTRDFFNMLINEIISSCFHGIKLFEGEMGHLVPAVSYDLVSGHFFELIGKMVLHAIINKCRGLKGISPAIIKYLVSGNRDAVLEDVTLHDIPDPCLRQTLTGVKNCILHLSLPPHI